MKIKCYYITEIINLKKTLPAHITWDAERSHHTRSDDFFSLLLYFIWYFFGNNNTVLDCFKTRFLLCSLLSLANAWLTSSMSKTINKTRWCFWQSCNFYSVIKHQVYKQSDLLTKRLQHTLSISFALGIAVTGSLSRAHGKKDTIFFSLGEATKEVCFLRRRKKKNHTFAVVFSLARELSLFFCSH